MQALEAQLQELREQVNIVQKHYGNMQEVMRRDQADKERAIEEANRVRKENKSMAAEIEGLKEANTQLATEREQLRMALAEYDGVREQLEVADRTMAQQHEMIIHLQEDNERLLKKKESWKDTAQKTKQKNA